MNHWVVQLMQETRLMGAGQTVLASGKGDVVIVWFHEPSESALIVEYHPEKPEKTVIQAFSITKQDLIRYLKQKCSGYFIKVNGLGLTSI